MANNVESTMTDLMTSLAIVFIMLMFAFMQNQGVEANQGSTKKLDAIQDSLAVVLEPLNLACVDDVNDPLACIIRLPDEQLKFKVNKADIDPQGKVFLSQLIPGMVRELTSDTHREHVESMFINGFTDSDGDDEMNLQLSQARAFSVGKHIVGPILNKPEFIKSSGKSHSPRDTVIDWLHLNGRGERELQYVNCGQTTCPENKKASRRVEIKIRVKSHEQRKLIEQQMKADSADGKVKS